MKLNFTEDDLKQYGRTFSKGLAYYENDSVGKIVPAIDKYTAQVFGSRAYQVEYSPATNKFSCNCPVAGVCKHIVAFGLKLLETKEQLPDVMDFDTWYQTIDDETKASFLRNILLKDSLLKSKFKKYTDKVGKTYEPQDIEDIAQMVYATIDGLSWEEAVSNYAYHDYYVEEYELIDELVKENLEGYNTEVLDLLSLGKTEEAFHYFLGVYLGIVRGSDTEIAEYCDYLEFPMEESRKKLFFALDNLPLQKQKTVLKNLIGFFKVNKQVDIGYFEKMLLMFLKKSELKPSIKSFLNSPAPFNENSG